MILAPRRSHTLWVDERRRFPRVKAPISFKPAPAPLVTRPVRDIGIGGLRVRCPQPLRVNEVHTVGVVMPSGRELRCRVRVVWSGGRREHEAGLQILAADADIREVLQVLEEHAEPDVDHPISAPG